MDPSGLFRVPHRRGSPSTPAESGTFPRAQRGQLETPPGLIVRPFAAAGGGGTGSPAFSDISSLRWTPERGGRDRGGGARESTSTRWPHYNLPPIWDSTSDGGGVGVNAFGSHRQSPDVDLILRRKRPLSISPIPSLDVDLNSLIRTSPNSLVAYVVGSRGSSAASGSYGHLVAAVAGGGKTSPSFHHLPGAPPQLMTRRRRDVTAEETESVVAEEGGGGTPPPAPPPLITMPVTEKMESSHQKTTPPPQPQPTDIDVDEEDDAKGEGQEGVEKQANAETDCHWKECERKFDIQDELVRHVNDDHIHGEKRDFICYWSGCSREQKPFKAQYMLVVHMRRHTGEKPHKCTVRSSSGAPLLIHPPRRIIPKGPASTETRCAPNLPGKIRRVFTN